MKRIVEKVWVDDTHVYARTRDGLMASYPFARWERLRNATKAQREEFCLSYTGIHWPSIDEDLSFEGMFCDAGLCTRTATEDSVCYLEQ